MIITQAKREIYTEGLEETKQMRLVKSEEVEAHIVKVLTENYRFPEASSIRESVSNHFDSHIENGNPEHPIIIKLYKTQFGNYKFESCDQGLGLNLEEFDKYYMGIGESSKRGKAELLGSKGCGAKAWLSLVDSYNVITRKNGKEWSFLVFKGEVFPERTVLYEKETSEPNGVIIKVDIPSYNFSHFKKAIKEQTCYFKTCFYQIEGEPNLNNAKIFENDLFTYSDIYPNDEMHIAFGPCHYPIEWKSLGINKIYTPIAIKIPIDSGIDVHFNRESLVYDSLCKEIILNKIKEVSEWFINKYNEQTKEFNSLLQAWDSIDSMYHYVHILDKKFDISELEKHSDVKFDNIKVKGIEHVPLKTYRRNYDYLVKGYKIIADKDYRGSFREGRASTYNKRLLENQTKNLLLHEEVKISGWFKQYLKSLNYKVFVKKTFFPTPDLKYYKQILGLQDYPKSKWRSMIQEWQRVRDEFISELIIDGTSFHTSKEFLDFKENNKVINSPYYRSSYQRLNKQKGDITLNVAVQKAYSNTYKLEKQVFALSSIHKQKTKFVVFTEEQKEICKQFAKNFVYFNRYKFVVVTKGEIKKLPKTKQFIMFAKIEKRPADLKLFSKIASAVLYHKELKQFSTIVSKIEDTIIENFSNNLDESVEKLQSFVSKYKGDYGNAEFLIQKAIDTNDFDLTLDVEYKQLKKFNERFGFIQFLECKRWQKEEFVKELNKQLLMRRLYNPDLYPEFEICVKEQQKQGVQINEEGN